MTTHPDALAFLRAICTAPADDLPRLAYADWLAENGQWGRAEFIRVQVALSRSTCAPGLCVRTCDCDRLRRHERGLWVSYTDPQQPWPVAPVLPGFDFRHLPGDPDQSRGRPHLKCCYYSRGFVSSVTCAAAEWLANADAIFWHPDQRVEFYCDACDGYGCDIMGGGVCLVCAGAGRGFSARPFPPTAQPISEVVLTTAPHERDFGTIEHMDWAAMTARYYRWPGTTFKLPPGA